MEQFLGQIMMFAGNFAPRGWALCNGQLLDINQYTALYSILGTTYGGDGRKTFALPDLQGRVPVHFGRGDGLQNITQGEKGGEAQVTLNVSQMPTHKHSAIIQAVNPLPRGVVASPEPNNAYNAHGGAYSTGKNIEMAPDGIAVGDAGEGHSHNNMQPFLGMNFIIAMNGMYPPRD